MPLHEADLELRGHALDVRRQPLCGRVGGISEDEQPSKPNHFTEDLDALVLKLPHVVRDACQVAAGPGHALHEAGGDGIAHMGEYHRNL